MVNLGSFLFFSLGKLWVLFTYWYKSKKNVTLSWKALATKIVGTKINKR